MSKPAIDHRDRLDGIEWQAQQSGHARILAAPTRFRAHGAQALALGRHLSALMETADVVRIGADSFRRNVGLQTGSRTITMGFQIVLPGEIAPPHRHTNTALRFVIQGGGAYTTSNGEPMIMYPGDLLIQPNWAWHDHGNHSKEPIIWIDALDSGLVNFLNASFRQEWSEGINQPLTKKDGASRRLYGPARQPAVQYESAGVPYHYKWANLSSAARAYRTRNTTILTMGFSWNTRTRSTAVTRF